jgi:hypothetical protein
MIWSLIGAVVLGLIVLLVGRFIIHAPVFPPRRRLHQRRAALRIFGEPPAGEAVVVGQPFSTVLGGDLAGPSVPLEPSGSGGILPRLDLDQAGVARLSG